MINIIGDYLLDFERIEFAFEKKFLDFLKNGYYGLYDIEYFILNILYECRGGMTEERIKKRIKMNYGEINDDDFVKSIEYLQRGSLIDWITRRRTIFFFFN